MSTTTKLNLDRAKAIAKEYFAATAKYGTLASSVRSQVVCGTTIEGVVAKCAFYIPGERPELGTVLLVLAISRKDGSVKELTESEF